mmetsp:Transcript_59329/g.162787  ORF Transcript_59329/g.162787 Transcript_59329/m.162787 type:complete len:170 (-) Transcript_59329:488-997(-)
MCSSALPIGEAPTVNSPPAAGTACKAQVLLRPWYDDLSRVERFLRKRSALSGPSLLGCPASAEVQGHVPDLQQLALEDEPCSEHEPDEPFVPHVRAEPRIMTPSTCNLDEDGLEPPHKSRRYGRAELRLSLSPNATAVGQKPRRRSSLSIASLSSRPLEHDIAPLQLEQ